MKREKLISLLLRLGLAFTFFYAAISGFINPNSWIGFLPGFIRTEITLNIFSIAEIILGLWLLWGKKIYYASIISAITLTGIVAFNLESLDIVFRDIAILLMAIVLAVLSKNK